MLVFDSLSLSLQAYEQPAPATIIEESSAESWVDPNANNYYPPPPQPPPISHRYIRFPKQGQHFLICTMYVDHSFSRFL